MHRWLATHLDSIKDGTRGIKINVVGPRGSAKSTVATLALVLREALSGPGALHFGLYRILKHQAAAHLENVKTELLENQRLRAPTTPTPWA